MRSPVPSTQNRPLTPQKRGDEGFLLLGAIVLVFLVLLVLTIAAPRIARSIQRDKELESQHRANQYVRAIRVYYKKFNHYPTTVEQLEKTNNQRFLRQKYIDPLTGKDDWRLIHVGENKTTVKGFFGQDLPGLQAGLGSASGMSSGVGSSTTGSNINTSAFNNNNLGAGGLGSTGTSGTSTPGSNGTTGTTGTTGGNGSTTGTSGIGSQDATTFTGGGGGPIMGIGSSRTGDAMLTVNGEQTYQTWEFLYDPRIEQLYAKATLLGGVSSGSATGLGSASNLASPTGTTTPGTTTPGTPSTPTSPTTPP